MALKSNIKEKIDPCLEDITSLIDNFKKENLGKPITQDFREGYIKALEAQINDHIRYHQCDMLIASKVFLGMNDVEIVFHEIDPITGKRVN